MSFHSPPHYFQSITNMFKKDFEYNRKGHFVNKSFNHFILFQPQDPGFHGQEKVYGDLGEEMLEHSFEGKQNTILQFYSCLRLEMYHY